MNLRHAAYVVLGTLAFLIIPLIATNTVEGFNWDPLDFVFAFVLIAGAGFAFLLLSSIEKNLLYKGAWALTVLTAFLLIWINAAVGLLGGEDNPANLLYGAVLAILFLGTIGTGAKARGMSVVVFLAAVTQLLVPAVAFLIWQPSVTGDLIRVVAISSFFGVLWLGAALLFRRASSY